MLDKSWLLLLYFNRNLNESDREGTPGLLVSNWVVDRCILIHNTCYVSREVWGAFYFLLNQQPQVKHPSQHLPTALKGSGTQTQCFLFSWKVTSESSMTPWTVARQAPLSTGFPRQETRVSCHFFLQGVFPTKGSDSQSTLAGSFFTTETPGKPQTQSTLLQSLCSSLLNHPGGGGGGMDHMFMDPNLGFTLGIAEGFW